MRRRPLLALTGMLAASTLAGCTGSGTQPAAAPKSTRPTAATVIVASVAPSSAECADASQIYKSQVRPALADTSHTGNGHLTDITVAFTAFAAATAAGDPRSQTVQTDALAVATYPTNSSDIATFNKDLQEFLDACGAPYDDQS